MKAQFNLEAIEDIGLDDQDYDKPSEDETSSLSIAVEPKPECDRMCVFGTCLEHLMQTSPCMTVPYVVSRLCKFIEKYGLYQQCLFQETSEKSIVEHLKMKFDESGDAPLESSGDVPAASVLLKLFFEELPEPLIPTSFQADFFDNMKKCINRSHDCVKHLRFLVDRLPCSVFCVLKYLSHFLLRIANHGERNGLNCLNLGIIFGPVIFRPFKKDPLMCIMIKNITHCFVADYYSIFEEDKCNMLTIYQRPKVCVIDQEDASKRQVPPVPSSVMLEVPMQPLKVVIPQADTLPQDCDHSPDDTSGPPVLLIEKSDLLDIPEDVLQKLPACGDEILRSRIRFCQPTRKRKENILSGDSVYLSDTEDLPSLFDMLETEEYLNDSNKYEVVLDHRATLDSHHTNEYLSSTTLSSEDDESVDYSPHPPDPKRRELDSVEYPLFVPKCEKYRSSKCSSGLRPWMSIKRSYEFPNKTVSFKDYNVTLDLAIQSDEISDPDKDHIQEEPVSQSPLRFLDIPLSSDDTSITSSSAVTSLSRSSSCPISITDGESNFESESTSLSLSWNSLFDTEEPVRSDHHIRWPILKGTHEEEPIASSNRNHHKYSSSEAPLSPSAYRSYLSHRSSHLDPSVPPSTPFEQLHFEKSPAEDSVSSSIKQVTKKIHALKKKISRFEERYESEYGYKPSHAEKTKFPEAKKLMSDLHKLRKSLKALKEESHMVADSCISSANWLSAREVHILEDTTNCLKGVGKDSVAKLKPTVQASFGETLKSLDDDRKLANRPSSIEDMTSDQVKDEKLAIQKVLLHFESIHGKPSTTSDRNTVRPLYDRYRNVKRLLVRSSSFPICTSKGNGLQPIMEHEAMDFSSTPDVKEGHEQQHDPKVADEAHIETEVLNHPSVNNSQFLDNKYNNSYLHELPLPEMILQQHHARVEKRRLHKILREFEAEFLRINGRKVQKEDKAPVEALYAEYKLVKARLRLLEALVSKHHEPIPA